MGAGAAINKAGAGLPSMQNPMQRQGGPMGGAMFGGQGGPMQQSPFPQFEGQNPNQIPQGIDPQAAATNPGDFFRYMQGMRAQEGAMPGSTMMSQPQGGKGGMPGGDRGSSLPPQLQELQRRIQEQNFMRGAPQQGGQGLAGLLRPQASSINSLK